MYSKWDYLNAGMGKPCAGQVIENIPSALILNVPRDSEDVGNIGLADPIGSKISFGLIYLNTRIWEWALSCAEQRNYLQEWKQEEQVFFTLSIL